MKYIPSEEVLKECGFKQYEYRKGTQYCICIQNNVFFEYWKEPSKFQLTAGTIFLESLNIQSDADLKTFIKIISSN